ncbi:MAG: flagellar biosynthesis regulator FlaF [Spiribacter salinus]|uniref:Flagellar biosynthesis regulator FlaF n=1 Tax=Spiribacter salinus TaxID=1335746 RepID=A0A540VVS3_9GAMM|nr:MAG: flagellar biosynthesis regulator FlaF [Spiribacter salinus]
MNATEHARRAYAGNRAPIRTDRGSEYEAFAKVTQKLQAALANAGQEMADASKKIHLKAQTAEAVDLNRRLWSLLAVDVLSDDNLLPEPTRASILSLNEFTRAHSRKVLNGEAEIRPLIEINAAIMRGLSQGRTEP